MITAVKTDLFIVALSLATVAETHPVWVEWGLDVM